MPAPIVNKTLAAAGVAAWLAAVCVAAETAAAPADPQRLAIQIEALSRLKEVDLSANPNVKNAVLRVLDQVRGRPEFVRLALDFKLKDQAAGLIEFAAAHPEESASAEAVRWLLDSGAAAPLEDALGTTNRSAGLIRALGAAADRRAVPLLAAALARTETGPVERRAAVRALAGTREGAQHLIELAKAGRLPAESAFTAAAALQQVRWEDLKRSAAEILPLPPGKDAEPLPPLAELLKLPAEAARGAAVFRRETSQCLACHQVRGEGQDFGPALSEIGSKLGKDALFEAILDPSSGISFGYEAWQIDTQGGDEHFGLIVSETAEEVAIKAQSGVVTRIRKAAIAKRTQQKLSIMPAGLNQTMTVQELADLVEYLASLRAAPAP